MKQPSRGSNHISVTFGHRSGVINPIRWISRSNYHVLLPWCFESNVPVHWLRFKHKSKMCGSSVLALLARTLFASALTE